MAGFSPAQPRRAETRRSASFVLGSTTSSTYPTWKELYWQLRVGWVEISRLRCLSRLRPCWTTILSIPGGFMKCEYAIPRNRSASMAAIQPEPAAVTA